MSDNILFAGAGASAGPPSSLPSWWLLNEWIMKQLRDRLHSALGWSDTQVSSWIEDALVRRTQEAFPPEYQAQIIEEVCGERYFQALQSLDVEVLNPAHRAIAASAAADHVRAIVTTNFDRLIERALDEQGVSHWAVVDDEGYQQLADLQQRQVDLPLVVLKIHGCVSQPGSMIDTLKQRLRGRSAALERCLDGFGKAHWLYLGFSAEDLVSNPDYLSLRRRAGESLGGTYLSYPGSPETPRGQLSDWKSLGAGAKLLMGAHGDKAEVWVEGIDSFLTARFGLSSRARVGDARQPAVSGREESKRKLEKWAEDLSPAATGLCLAAIFEAVGNAEGAARLLDRLVRKEFILPADRDSEDYRAVQLHYGRLGAAWGRFLGVPDLHGMESNASVETAQSLLRLHSSELQFPAKTWLMCHQLWLGRGDLAMQLAAEKLAGLENGFPPDDAPRNEEDILDAWIAVAHGCLIDEGRETLQQVIDITPRMVTRAQACGDAIRAARVAALGMLASGRRSEDVRDEFNALDPIFAQAERVFDGFALGMRHLALGRWLVGSGGIALSKTLGQKSVARAALRSLGEAIQFFSRQGMDPWILYTTIQIIKAHGDLQDFEAAQAHANDAAQLLERFPIFEAHLREAQFQLLYMGGSEQAVAALEHAIEAAATHGLKHYQRMLQATRRTIT